MYGKSLIFSIFTTNLNYDNTHPVAMKKLHILVVDDEPGIRNEIEEYLVGQCCMVTQAGLPSEALRILDAEPVDICILDVRMPEMTGIELLARIRQEHPSVECMIMTAHGDMDSVVSAMRYGAIDFFNKPFSLKDLDRAIQKTKTYFQFQRENTTKSNDNYMISPDLRKLIGRQIIAESRQMKELIRLMHKVAPASGSNVLITGESGTGKELIAKGIHYLSPRQQRPFYPVNCASIPEELFESEFFGHTRGAFTGAMHEKAGWFETAHKSTLFMDEIADLKIGSQPKLLRILDDMMVVRLGSTKKVNVDVRVIAATNHNLEELVQKRSFRPDLYYRLNAITFHIPPLRERREDTLPLFYHFLAEYASSICKPINFVAPEVKEWLQEYHFPGNVRELRHMVERAIILSSDHTLELKHFIRSGPHSGISKAIALPYMQVGLYDLEKQTISQALKKAKYVKSHTARLLNISRQALDRKISKYGIQVDWK
jgi:DNA-binding NtrC family response regulator